MWEMSEEWKKIERKTRTRVLVYHNVLLNDIVISSVKSLSCVWIFAIPWTAARLPCPSPTPGTCSNSYTLSKWCHPTISSSVVPFSSCLQSLQASVSFPMSQLYVSGGQSVGASASASVLPMIIQDWDNLGRTGLISLQSKGLPRFFSNTIVQKHAFLWHSAFFMVQLSHPYMTTGKTVALTWQTFVSKVISLLFNMLLKLVIAFLPRSKCLLISWLQSYLQWFWSPRKQSLSQFSLFSHLFAWSDGTRCHDFHFFECWVLNQPFHSPLSLSSEAL